uniref:Uncharacterized protein n=1 Tax=Anguilla anguilla TaxID=7936 RepID=A0A0E9UKD3_ANGAN
MHYRSGQTQALTGHRTGYP